MKQLKKILAFDRVDIILCLVFTYIWGFASHGYMFLNNSVSHDSLSEFILTPGPAGIVNWKISLGRYILPVYEYLFRGIFTQPWLIGILSLFFIGISVYLICQLLHVRFTWMAFLIAGILTANNAMTAQIAVYIHDLDGNAMALLLAVMSVVLWRKTKLGFLTGMIPLCLSLGLYQSFFSVAITLIMVLSIMDLLSGSKFNQVFWPGVRAIVMLVGAGLFFLVGLKAALWIADVELISGTYNSFELSLELSIGEMLRQIVETWQFTLQTMLNPLSEYPEMVITVSHILLFGGTLLTIIAGILRKEIGISEKILICVLCLLLPIGMNVSRILTGGMSHDLMHYPLFLSYVVYLLVGSWLVSQELFPVLTMRKLYLAAAAAVIFVLLWGNVRLANKVYLIKDFEQDALLSYFTRVTDRIEEQEDYIQGETPIAFIGIPDHVITLMPYSDPAYDLTGTYYPYPWYTGTVAKFEAYYRYILLNPAIIANDDTVNQLAVSQAVIDLPAYPDERCMKLIDNVLVVKLGN